MDSHYVVLLIPKNADLVVVISTGKGLSNHRKLELQYSIGNHPGKSIEGIILEGLGDIFDILLKDLLKQQIMFRFLPQLKGFPVCLLHDRGEDNSGNATVL